MSIDPLELAEDEKDEKKDKAKSTLNAMVAVTIALLATFMGVCKVKDDNIVQAMQQSQADRIDQWGYRQAKNTQAKIYEVSAAQFKAQSLSATGAAKAELEKLATQFDKRNKDELSKVAEGDKAAKKAEDDYNSSNYRDDQFDLSDTLMAIAISMLAVTALTGKRWLYWIALVPTALGVLMGVAGLFSLKIHPDAITNLLSVARLFL